ncbi:MFS transporter [Streptomyces yaizuensis]|uniref:MFS transporter n=1 Tax=Streptomyces yaizuensis TaxID=2989713 RepID=A0ABQ5P5I0_9ACTN|nr:MFS transporter [Streptomyces sp. YSPA8]GLF97491.1 MFS transporter [Streptomyces sp. YSPA8]
MPSKPLPPPASPALPGRPWALLLVLCGAIFLEGIDVAMLAIAVPEIRADLGLSTATAAWVISAYVIGYAGFTLLGGRAADLLGRRRMFLGWLVVFLVFSALGGVATEGWMLIVSRFVTGVASAFMTPASLSVITTSYPEGPRRNKALLIFAGTSAGGFSLGLVIGGLLTQFGWRWVFFAPVLLAAAILLAAVRLIPRDRPAVRQGGFDLAGAASGAGAMVVLTYGIVRLEHGLDGWVLTLAAIGAGLLLLSVFVVVERRSPAPLVRLGILRRGQLVRADLGAMMLFGGFFGFQFMLTLYLQELRGWSSLETSFALLLMGVDVLLAPTVTPLLVNRYGHGRVIFSGFVLAAVAYVLFLPVGSDWTYPMMVPTLLLLGLSFGLAYGPLTIAATDGVDPSEQGLAGGLITTANQFGAAVGVALVTAVHGLSGTGLDAFRASLVVPVAMAVTGLALSAPGLRTGARVTGPGPVPVPRA